MSLSTARPQWTAYWELLFRLGADSPVGLHAQPAPPSRADILVTGVTQKCWPQCWYRAGVVPLGAPPQAKTQGAPRRRTPPYLGHMYLTTPALYLLGQGPSLPLFSTPVLPCTTHAPSSCSGNVLKEVLVLVGYLTAGLVLCAYEGLACTRRSSPLVEAKTMTATRPPKNATLHSTREPRNPCNEAREEQQRRLLEEEAPQSPSVCVTGVSRLARPRQRPKQVLHILRFPSHCLSTSNWRTRRHARGHLHTSVFSSSPCRTKARPRLLQQASYCQLDSPERCYLFV